MGRQAWDEAKKKVVRRERAREERLSAVGDQTAKTEAVVSSLARPLQITLRVSWQAPRTAEGSFFLRNVTGCFAAASPRAVVVLSSCRAHPSSHAPASLARCAGRASREAGRFGPSLGRLLLRGRQRRAHRRAPAEVEATPGIQQRSSHRRSWVAPQPRRAKASHPAPTHRPQPGWASGQSRGKGREGHFVTWSARI